MYITDRWSDIVSISTFSIQRILYHVLFSMFYFCSTAHIFLELSFYFYMNLTESFVNLKNKGIVTLLFVFIRLLLKTEKIIFEKYSFILPKKLQRRIYHFKMWVHFIRSYLLKEVWLYRANCKVETTIQKMLELFYDPF